MTRLRGERGATVAEAAFVVPMLFMSLLAFLDYSLWVMQSNQASAVARDGARTGIVSYRQADVPGSGDYNNIDATITRRLGGQHNYTLTIICMQPATPSQVSCNSNPASGTNRIQVTVTWTRRALSPFTASFGKTQTVTGTAVMQVIS